MKKRFNLLVRFIGVGFLITFCSFANANLTDPPSEHKGHFKQSIKKDQLRSKEAQKLLRKGLRALSQKSYVEAADLFRLAAQIEHNWPTLYKNIGKAHESSGEYGGAINAYLTYIEKVPGNPDQKIMYRRVLDLKHKLSKDQDLITGTKQDFWLK